MSEKTTVAVKVRRATYVEETVQVVLPLYTSDWYVADGPGDGYTIHQRITADGKSVIVKDTARWRGGHRWSISVQNVNIEADLDDYLPSGDYTSRMSNAAEFEKALGEALAALAAAGALP